MSSAWKKTNNELEKEFRDAEDELYNATILVLYKFYGWRKLRIERFLNKASEVYDECGSSNKVSLVQMCDLELGIEVRNNKNETYKDTPYLNNDKWEIEKKNVFNKMNPVQRQCYMIRVRQKMKDWMFPQMLASIFLALHRKEGWGADKVLEFAEKVQEVRKEHENNIKSLKAAVKKECNIDYEWVRGKIEVEE